MRSPLDAASVSDALAERIAEVIDEFAECNKITEDDVMLALEYTHACVERGLDSTPASKLN
jgi:hypothetical protein